MKKYTKPSIDLINFTMDEIICSSSVDFGGSQAGDNPFEFGSFFS